MFLRQQIRRKDGRGHRAWSVVENRRVHSGRVVQRRRVSERLVRADELEREEHFTESDRHDWRCNFQGSRSVETATAARRKLQRFLPRAA